MGIWSAFALVCYCRHHAIQQILRMAGPLYAAVGTVELEIKDMLEEAPPEWIVTRAEDNIENEMVKRHLQEKYAVCMTNEDYKVYRRRE